MLDYLVYLLLKLSDVVASTIKVGTCPGYTLHNPPCFFDLLFSVPVQRQLRRMKRDSIAAMNGSGGTEGNQNLVVRCHFSIAQHPF